MSVESHGPGECSGMMTLASQVTQGMAWAVVGDALDSDAVLPQVR